MINQHEVQSLLPAVPQNVTFENDAAGKITKVWLSMKSIDTGSTWQLEITPVFGTRMDVRLVR
ncbi:hypothetical protein M0R72_17960 [Candidatus Pacearchaeota archaeon]|jgi:hypothetical protein|nr:hypothetical protein [Candidatus Pacearchaeota archaeon]